MDAFTHQAMSKAQAKLGIKTAPDFSKFEMDQYDGPEVGSSLGKQTFGSKNSINFKSKDFGLKGLGAWNRQTTIDFGDGGGTPVPSSFGG